MLKEELNGAQLLLSNAPVIFVSKERINAAPLYILQEAAHPVESSELYAAWKVPSFTHLLGGYLEVEKEM